MLRLVFEKEELEWERVRAFEVTGKEEGKRIKDLRVLRRGVGKN